METNYIVINTLGEAITGFSGGFADWGPRVEAKAMPERIAKAWVKFFENTEMVAA